jgi:hypothetical protein
LAANTTYYYYAMSVNTACTGAPFYLTTLPLKNNVLTCTDQTASLTGTSVSTTTATINFTPIVGAISYQLEYRINGVPTWTVATPAPTTSPYTLTGLSAGNIYDIRIEGPNANCGNRRTTNSAFTTPCSNLTLPVFQGFESGTTIPPCWTQQYVSGTKNCSFGSTTTAVGTSPNPVAFAGVNRLLFPSYTTSGNQTRVFTPPITTIGTASVDVNYQWYFSTNGGSTSYLTEGVQVLWSTNGTSWTNAGSLVRRYGATDGWQKQVITLPAGAGNQLTLYVGFLLTANAGYDAYIDDVEVKATPVCSVSNGGTITAVSNSICGTSGSTTITAVNYTASVGGLSYQWQSSTDNFVSNIVDIAGATNSASLNTGIITNTTSYRLRVFCTVVGYGYSNVVTVTVTNPQINTTTPATRCGIGTVNLHATATSGSVIKWYTVASGGASIATGSPFTTPSISATTTYYVAAASAGSTIAAVGPTSPSSQGGTTDNQTINWRVYFDVLQATTLQSVDVFPITAGQTATLYVFNTGGTQLIAVPYTTTVSGGTTAQTIPINLALTVGANYNLYASGIPTSGLKRNTSGAVYPYTSSSINITGNGYDNTYYMCYYNWKFVTGCESARTAVVATVTPPPAIALSASTATICSGSNTTVTVTAGTVGNFTSYSWSPTTAVAPGGVPSGSSATLSPTATTTYTVSGSTAAGCVNQASIVVTVNPAPPVTVGAAVCSGNSATISATSTCTNFTNAGTAIPGNWNATTDPVAIQPVIFLPNSTTCEFDPTGNTMNYTTTTFQVSVTGSYTFAMDANASYDGMGYIVTGPFVPGVCPGSGTWVVGDDDSGPSSLEPLMTANLTAGTTYTLISTCYSSTSGTVTGAFNWGITPPSGGQITTVSNGNLQWYTTAVGGSPISTSSPFNPVGVVGSGIATASSVGAYTFYAACSNNTGCRTATGYAIGAPGQWIGASNSTWANTANWCGTLPTTSTNVIIPNGAPNMPVLSTGIGTVNNLTVNTGAMLTISNATMQIAGAITASTGTINATTGTIELVGTTAQTIAGSAFTGRNVQNVVASNNVNVSAIANDTLRITGALSFGNTNNKTINSNDNITLVSNAAGTARTVDITNNGINTGNTINGKFVVERFIPARRAWRLLTTPIANGAQTINQAWQEGVGGTWSTNLKPGYGTHITGGSLRTTAQGFDQGPNNPSIYGYSGVNWNQLPATTAELTSTRQGYMVFIRGSRSIDLPASTPGTVPDNTVLRPTGSIKVGSQPAITNPSGGFTVVGNPYPSAINFNNVTKSNVIGGVGGNNAYYLWDPNLGGNFGYGAFVALSWNGTSYDKNISTSNVNTNGIISSGAAFMVNVNAGGSVTFDENDKVADGTGTSILFRPIRNRTSLSVTLATVNGDGSLYVNDGALLTCTRESSNEVNKEDAVKINNFAENFCFQHDSINIAIERRQSISLKDTLLFSMWNMKQKKYALIISTANFVLPQNALMYVEDNYLQTKTLVHTNYADTLLFDITSDVKSAAKNRFRLIFNNEKSQNLLTNQSAPAIVIAPNPVIGTEVNFLTNNIPNGTYSLSVITQDGKILATNKWMQNNQLINGQQGQFPLQQKLTAGNYLLKVVGNNLQPMAIPFIVE